MGSRNNPLGLNGPCLASTEEFSCSVIYALRSHDSSLSGSSKPKIAVNPPVLEYFSKSNQLVGLSSVARQDIGCGYG